jgi:hypothetical protein
MHPRSQGARVETWYCCGVVLVLVFTAPVDFYNGKVLTRLRSSFVKEKDWIAKSRDLKK